MLGSADGSLIPKRSDDGILMLCWVAAEVGWLFATSDSGLLSRSVTPIREMY